MVIVANHRRARVLQTQNRCILSSKNMNQGLFTESLRETELVYGGGLLFLLILCFTIGDSVGFKRVREVGVVMFLLVLNKTWNNTGFLSLWWSLGVYVTVLHCGEGFAFLVWNHGCVWWPITGVFFPVMTLHWCGKLMHVWPLRLRRWELKGIVRNIVNAFGLFALGITYGLSDQYKEYYIAFDTNGELCLLVAQIFLKHKCFIILLHPFDYSIW